jgi:HAE1 family hydrophobic/amphiphilic exporter-1
VFKVITIIFVPIAFTTGYARRYLNQFGWTMAFSAMVSMLVSFTLTPMLCSRLLGRIRRKTSEPPSTSELSSEPDGAASKDNRLFSWIDSTYGKLLEWALDHSGTVAWLALGTFALTFPLNALVGRDFIPADDQSELTVVFDAPVGTSLQGTAKIATQLAREIERNRAVSFAWAGVINQDNHSQVYVRLADVAKRKASSADVANDIRQILAKPEYADLRAVVLLPSVLGSSVDYGTIRPLISGPIFMTLRKLPSGPPRRCARSKGWWM